MPDTLMELMRLAEDVYIFRAQNHVAMFITTPAGVILCDPCGQTNKRTPFALKEVTHDHRPARPLRRLQPLGRRPWRGRRCLRRHC